MTPSSVWVGRSRITSSGGGMDVFFVGGWHGIILSVLGRGFYTPIKARKGGGTAAGLRRLAARSRGCNKVAFPPNSSAAEQQIFLLSVFSR